MAITFGDINVNGWYFGDQAIEALYYGDTEVWSSTPTRDYSKEYLTFKINSTGNLRFASINSTNIRTIEYSKDSGTTWTQVDSSTGNQSAPFTGGTMIPVSQGDIVMLRGAANNYGSSMYYNGFEGTDVSFEVYGNIISLIYGSSFTGQTSIPASSYNFRNFFSSCSGLTSMENLVLPNNTKDHCFSWFAQHCTSLTKTPELPATTLATGCYRAMFRNTAITDSPIIPDATVSNECCRGMFDSCSALTGITCYCASPSDNAFSGWVNGVATSGTFTKAAGANWSTGVSGIPANWIVVEV